MGASASGAMFQGPSVNLARVPMHHGESSLKLGITPQTSPLYECKRKLIQTTIVGEAKQVKHRENKEQSDPSKAPIREGQSKEVDTESHATRYLGPVKRGSS
jgi:hypothetical protein